jgi:TolB-like protein/Tfp pilus assembly protein PilF
MGSDYIPADNGARLDSWKAIAEYLGREVRSVQRWEKTRGLPVRRVPGEKGGVVFAYTRELDQWLHSRSPILPERPEEGETAASDASDSEERVSDLESKATRRTPKPEEPAVAAGRSGRRVVIAVIGTSILLVASVAYLGRHLSRQSASAATGRAILAVLPFTNLSGDPSQEYFADGLTEEMITDLGRISPASLGVIARTSAMKYKDTHQDIGQIGQELGASYVLEGSVRRDGARARISAQLIRVSDQTHLWAQNYDVGVRDILSVQRDVAAAIATNVRLNLAGNAVPLQAIRPANDEAYDAFLKALYFFGRRDYTGITQSVPIFEEAIRRDPNYAPAYAGLAEALTFVGVANTEIRMKSYQKARAAAARAIALDDSSAEAHTALGGIQIFLEHDWAGAQTQFTRALQLDPNYAHAHHWYANLYLDPQGRFDEAIQEMRVAQELDPTNLVINADLGQAYFFARRYEEAIETYQKVLAMDRDFLPVHWYLTDCYFQMGRHEDEVQEYRTWL